MKKTIFLALGSIALITLLTRQGSLASISVTDDRENGYVNAPSIAMACAPDPDVAKESTAAQGDFRFSAFLSDQELTKFKYESVIFELGPGQSDTISHRHDCDVFVTVLEGALLIGQEFKIPDTLRAGEVFHEHRNVIHSISVNPSRDQRMKAFIVFIRKDGRERYTPLYPKS